MIDASFKERKAMLETKVWFRLVKVIYITAFLAFGLSLFGASYQGGTINQCTPTALERFGDTEDCREAKELLAKHPSEKAYLNLRIQRCGILSSQHCEDTVMPNKVIQLFLISFIAEVVIFLLVLKAFYYVVLGKR